jgi:hypothetical protein
LRQSVLESHGWTIHRLWSTDWFYRPNEQIDAIVTKIEAAKAEHDADAGAEANRSARFEIYSVEREDLTEMGIICADEVAEAASANLYIEAVISRPAFHDGELHETAVGVLAALVEEAVRIEGPVHIDEVIERIRSAWGLKRAGGRIQQACCRPGQAGRGYRPVAAGDGGACHHGFGAVDGADRTSEVTH